MPKPMAITGFVLASAAVVAAIFWRFPYWYTPFTIGSFLFFDRLSGRWTGHSVLQFIARGHWRVGALIYFIAAGLAFIVDVLYGRMLADAWIYPPWRGIASIAVPVFFHYPFGFLSLHATFPTVRGLFGVAAPRPFDLDERYGRVSLVVLALCLVVPLLNFWLNANRGEVELLFVVMLVSTVAFDGTRDSMTGDSMLRELGANGWRYAAAIIITLAWAVLINEGPNVFAREWVYLTHPFGLPLWLILILGWPFLLAVSATVYETTITLTRPNLGYTAFDLSHTSEVVRKTPPAGVANNVGEGGGVVQTTLHGRQVAYEEKGEGRPLLLIHGYPLNRTMWESQLHGLADVVHVIAPDLWGFGESEPKGEVTIGTYAEEVHALAEAVGATGPAVVCGLSMGGYIAFEYFLRYKDQVAGLILANTKAGPDSEEGKAGRDKSAALAKEKGAAAIAEAMLPKMLSPKTYTSRPELVEQVKRMMESASVPGIVAALTAMRDRPDSTPTLAQIKQPALVIGGADDQLFPQIEFQNMAKALTRGRLEILADAGHISNLEQPELFNRAVREFLQSVG